MTLPSSNGVSISVRSDSSAKRTKDRTAIAKITLAKAVARAAKYSAQVASLQEDHARSIEADRLDCRDKAHIEKAAAEAASAESLHQKQLADAVEAADAQSLALTAAKILEEKTLSDATSKAEAAEEAADARNLLQAGT